MAIMLYSCDNACPNAHVRIKNRVSGIGHGENKPFYKLDRKLARMNGLFDMIALDIREYP